MSVPTTGTNPAFPAWTPPSTTASAAGSELGKDAFLKLLVAQLRYQDPMNPAEGAEFIAQTAQFTQVEKLQEVADSTSASLTLQQRWGAGATVGRQVDYVGADGLPASGTVTAAVFTAAEPVLKVTTSTGATVQVPFAAVQGMRDAAAQAAVPPAALPAQSAPPAAAPTTPPAQTTTPPAEPPAATPPAGTA